MIIIRLTGGFGNQLFQFSAALLLAKSHKISEIIIDDSALDKYKSKNINILIKYLDLSKFDVEISIRKKFISKFRIPKIFPFFVFVSDVNFRKALVVKFPFYILDGYFQDCFDQEWFEKIAYDIKGALNFTEFRKNNPHECAVHIRGGDFLELGWDAVSPPEYYYSAMKFMEQIYGVIKFSIITDDVVFANKIINKNDFECDFCCGSIGEDFQNIGSFSYRILSSSTFSFWASFIGVEDGLVIAPELWTTDRKRLLKLPREITHDKITW